MARINALEDKGERVFIGTNIECELQAQMQQMIGMG